MRFRLLALAALLLPLESRTVLLTVAGLGVTLTELAVYAAVAACTMVVLRHPRAFDALDWAALGWAAAWVAAGLGAPWAHEAAVRHGARLATGALLCVLARASFAPGERERLGRVLGAAGVLAAASGWLDILLPGAAGPLFSAFRIKATTSSFGVRAAGTFEHANQLSDFLEVTLPFTLLWTAGPGRDRIRMGRAGLVIGVGSLVWAMSRAGWVSGAAGLALALAAGRRRVAHAGRLALVLATVPLALFSVSPRLRGRLLWPAVRPPFSAAYGFRLSPSPRIVVMNTGTVPWPGGTRAPDRVRLSVFGRRLTPPPKEAEVLLDLPGDVPAGGAVEVPIDPAGTLPPGRYLHVYEVVHPTFGYASQWDIAPLSGETEIRGGRAILRYGSGGGPLRRPKASRPQLWAAAWRAFLARPSFGWGPGMFQRFSPNWLPGVEYDPRLHPNQLYLHHLAEGGVPAFLALCAVVVAAAVRLAGRLGGRRADLPACAAAGALLAWCLHGFADSFILFNGTGWMLWLALAVGCPRNIYNSQKE